jgi:ATPase subunit of ABC transporter with duplicated ATPase domains
MQSLPLRAGWTGVVGASRADEVAFLRTLAGSPDVRIVEYQGEATDEERAALVASLRTYNGVGLIASRDRALLDELTTATVRIDRSGTPRLYAGNYTTARAAWQAEGEARGRERAAANARGSRHDARLAEQAHLSALAAERERTAALGNRATSARWKGNAAMRGRK